MPNSSEYHCQEPRAKSPNSVLKILIVYQKPYTIPPLDDNIFIPIQTGRAISSVKLDIQGDNELNGQPCENISMKNDYYAETTALFWAWKNLKKLYPDVKYIGLMHHRRFFALNEDNPFSETICKPEAYIQDFRYNPQEIIDILESGKIIVPKRLFFSYSVAAQYCCSHVSDDYRTCKNVIKENFPEYFDIFVNVMERNNKLSSKIIFIMKWEDFEKYCEFLFAVLGILEEKINCKRYHGTNQARVLAFLSERLFYVWQLKNKKKQKFCALYLCDDAAFSKTKHSLLNFFIRFLDRIRIETAATILFLPVRIYSFLFRRK